MFVNEANKQLAWGTLICHAECNILLDNRCVSKSSGSGGCAEVPNTTRLYLLNQRDWNNRLEKFKRMVKYHFLFFIFQHPVLLVLLGKHHCKDHDDVMKWYKFPRYWPFVRGIHRSAVNSPHKDQWRGGLMFSLICAWTNAWVINRRWFESPSRL